MKIMFVDDEAVIHAGRWNSEMTLTHISPAIQMTVAITPAVMRLTRSGNGIIQR